MLVGALRFTEEHVDRPSLLVEGYCRRDEVPVPVFSYATSSMPPFARPNVSFGGRAYGWSNTTITSLLSAFAETFGWTPTGGVLFRT